MFLFWKCIWSSIRKVCGLIQSSISRAHWIQFVNFCNIPTAGQHQTQPKCSLCVSSLQNSHRFIAKRSFYLLKLSRKSDVILDNFLCVRRLTSNWRNVEVLDRRFSAMRCLSPNVVWDMRGRRTSECVWKQQYFLIKSYIRQSIRMCPYRVILRKYV